MKAQLPLIWRLVLLALVTVVVQESAVSQISIFGVSADLTPLVVMSVGLLAGSLPGAIMGFGTGLLVDTVLVPLATAEHPGSQDLADGASALWTSADEQAGVPGR